MKYNRWYSSLEKYWCFCSFVCLQFAIILPLAWIFDLQCEKQYRVLSSLPCHFRIKYIGENYAYAVKYGVGQYF